MYSQYYGLTGNPFQLTPDPRFYFESETHRKAMAYLGYGLAQGEGFIVITGDIGAGKTTLVGHLMATIDKARLTAVQLVSTQVEGDDMLRLVAQQLGLDSTGLAKAQLLDKIERYLHTQAREGKRVLLIVDEAQNLGTSALEELRMLSNFQSGGRAYLQIFLLGQPEFRERVRTSPNLEQLRQRIIATHHLEAMQGDEIEPYIVHRLHVAGWQGRPQFTSDVFPLMYKLTGGVPRKLNTFMARILLFGAVEELDTIDGAAVEAVYADLDEETNEVEQPIAVEPAYEAPVSIAPSPSPSAAQEVPFSPLQQKRRREVPVEDHDAMEGHDDPLVDNPSHYPSLVDMDHSVGVATPNRHEEHVDDVMHDTHDTHDTTVTPPEFVANENTRPHAVSEPAPAFDAELAERVAALEARVQSQEASLRRVLTLLVNWVEGEESRLNLGVVRGSAA